jgi:hypothetical protein
MTDSSDANPAIPAAIIDSDTPCRRCGYNLRGLSADGQCPECGTLIRLSLRRDLLEHSDPAWVDSLRQGVGWMLWYAAGWVVFIVGFIILHAQMMRIPAGVLTAMYAWGRYLATKPDPSGLGEAEYGTSRRVVRVTIVISLFGLVVSVIRTAVLGIPELVIVLTGLEAITETTAVVGVFAQMHYFEKLTLRIPDAGLSQRSRFLKFAIGISGGIVVSMLILLQLANRSGVPLRLRSVKGVLGCGTCLGGFPLLIFVLMYVNFLGKLAARLRQVAEVARKSWSSPV